MVVDFGVDPGHGAKIKVIGIGGGGTNAVNTMIKCGVEGVDFVSVNTDIQSLNATLSPSKIQIGKELTKGLGAGANPDIGRDAALEDRHQIHESLVGADMVFITAGMGGGTGTGGAGVVSQIAKEQGSLTVGVVTKPFAFEGRRRMVLAEHGIERMRELVDTLIVIPNQRLLQIATPDLSLVNAFSLVDNVLVNAVRGISDIINITGTVNVDFADVKAIMSCTGQALMGIGSASGEGRATEAAKNAILSPLLEDIDIEGATGILINISASSNISLMEANEACSIVQEAAHEDANIIFGTVIDESMGEDLRVTVIATGFPNNTETATSSKTYRSNALNSNQKTSPLATMTPKAPSSHSVNSGGLSVKAEAQSNFASQTEATAEQPVSVNTEVQQLSQKPEATGELSAEDLAFLTYNQASTQAQEPTEDQNQRSPTEVLSSATEESSTLKTENPLPSPEPAAEAGGISESSADEAWSDDNHRGASHIAQDINTKIDEALSLTERLSQTGSQQDDIDVPTFLRRKDNSEEPRLPQP